MRPHRAIWLITGTVVLLAALVLFMRKAGESIPAASILIPLENQRQVIEAMIEGVKADPYANRPDTRSAIAAAADLAARGILATAETSYALGLTSMEANEFAGAESAFRKAIALKPDWSWPCNALGILLANYTKDRTAEAEEAYRTAIRLDPNWSRPYNDLAILLRLTGRLAEAEKMSIEAIRLDPESVATCNNYGNLLVAQRRLSEAEAQYRKAIDLEPEHPKPYYNLACVYCLEDRKEEALALLAKAVARNPALREDAQRDPDFAPLVVMGEVLGQSELSHEFTLLGGTDILVRRKMIGNQDHLVLVKNLQSPRLFEFLNGNGGRNIVAQSDVHLGIDEHTRMNFLKIRVCREDLFRYCHSHGLSPVSICFPSRTGRSGLPPRWCPCPSYRHPWI